MKKTRKVWVAGGAGNPLQTGFVGTPTDNECEEGCVEVMISKNTPVIVNKDMVYNLVAITIDEKNILSDWIKDELYDDCVVCKNEYMGFINDLPVYCKTSEDRLWIIYYDPKSTEFIKNYITQNFNDCNEHSIVCHMDIYLYSIAINFYCVIDNNGDEVFIKNKK